MNDNELHELMRQARRGAARVDWSPGEYGFETRLTARLTGNAADNSALFSQLWCSVTGCSALTGMLGVWFILTHAPIAAEDDLTAFWDAGQASYHLEFLN